MPEAVEEPLEELLRLAGSSAPDALTTAGEGVAAVEPDDVPAVLLLALHTDPAVRRGLAMVISRLPDADGGDTREGDAPRDDVLATALSLTTDADPRARDWACFTLGTLWRDLDVPALREALAARLDDADDDARCEALLGLALRRDARALTAVRAALADPAGHPWRLELEAAGALGDPALHPLVLAHLDGWDESDRAAVDAVHRLTDPAGLGDDVLDGVADLYRRRSRGEPDGDALRSWHAVNEALDLAPHRAPEVMAEVEARLLPDPAALAELHERSALAVWVGILDGG